MTFFNRQREWYFYIEEIISRNNNLLIHNDVSLNGNLNVKNINTINLSVNTNFGTSGQVLTSNGSGSAVSWEDQIDTTYSAGTGVTINGSNEINIGQSVETYDAVTFKSLNLLKDYSINPIIDPIINFTDNQYGGILAQIQMSKDITNGGKLQFFTKRNQGSLEESFTINQGGGVKITTDYVGLQINSQDDITEQSLIYNSNVSANKDMTIDAAVGSSNKGILFKTNSGQDRMRIGHDGRVGIGTINPTAPLEVNGLCFATGGFNGGFGSISCIGTGSFSNIRPIFNLSYTYDIGTSGAQYRVGYAFSWSSSSDDRLKDNERDISGALETIMKLKPQTYDFKNSEEPDATHIGLRSGFIAQDVLEIPELAHAVNIPENETEKVGKELDESGNIIDSDKQKKCYLSLDYNTIFTHAVKAIQELDTIVQSQQETIDALMLRLEALENKQ